MMSHVRLSIGLIAEKLGISKDMSHTIARDELGKRKICSRFVPHKLTDEQKAKRMKTSGDFISMCDQDPFLVETWCYQFDPESKGAIDGVMLTDFPVTKKKKKKNHLQKSKVKTQLIAFLDNKGIIHKELVPAGQTINVTFYQTVLNRLL